jgi:hypothetical protein
MEGEKMNTKTNTVINETSRLFRDAEHLWFWFVSSRRIQIGGRAGTGGNRPCELVDIEALVTRLFLSGRLTREQLDVMQEFGMRRRAPSQHIYAENRAAVLWSSAMRIMQHSFQERGWVE